MSTPNSADTGLGDPNSVVAFVRGGIRHRIRRSQHRRHLGRLYRRATHIAAHPGPAAGHLRRSRSHPQTGVRIVGRSHWRPPVLLGGLLAFAAASAAFVIAGDPAWLGVTRFAQGAAAAAFSPAAGVLVSRLTAPGQQGRGFGRYGAWKGLGYTLGPVLGGCSSPGAATPCSSPRSPH